jgi:hypothetical protein
MWANVSGVGWNSARSQQVHIGPSVKVPSNLHAKLAYSQSMATAQCGLLPTSKKGASLLATLAM